MKCEKRKNAKPEFSQPIPGKDAAYTRLFNVGVRVVSPSVVERLGKTGQVEACPARASAAGTGDVKMSPELVESAVQSAPDDYDELVGKGDM